MKYFIIENDRQAGPFSIYELKDKNIDSGTLVWAEGMKEWTPAWQVDELKAFLYGRDTASTPPPIPQNLHQNHEEQYVEIVQKPTSGSGKGCLFGFLLLGLGILLAITRPTEEDHKQAIKTVVVSALSKSTADGSAREDIFGMLGNLLATQLVRPVLDGLLEYHNYVLFSTTTATFGGEEHITSLGVLGQIFTGDEDDIKNAVKDKQTSGHDKSKNTDDESIGSGDSV